MKFSVDIRGEESWGGSPCIALMMMSMELNTITWKKVAVITLCFENITSVLSIC